jgi:hypothetical protein
MIPKTVVILTTALQDSAEIALVAETELGRSIKPERPEKLLSMKFVA